MIAVLALALPGAAAAQDPAEPAAAPAAPPAAEPAPTAEPAPAAQPAQSGPNEYSEGGVPTGTGEDDEPAPVEEPTQEADPAPTNSGQTTPTGGSAPAQSSADTTVTPTETGLPRTGADTWLVALIGLALLGAGLLARRSGIATPPS